MIFPGPDKRIGSVGKGYRAAADERQKRVWQTPGEYAILKQISEGSRTASLTGTVLHPDPLPQSGAWGFPVYHDRYEQ